MGTSAPSAVAVQTATVEATVTLSAEESPTPTPDATSPRPTSGAVSRGRIIYLDPDGFTVKSVLHDGTSPRTEAVVMQNMPDDRVVNLSASPANEYLIYSLSRSNESYLQSGDLVTKLSYRIGTPRWSPDGKRFVSQPTGGDSLGSVFLYDTANNTGEILPVSGVPDWFPDGKRLVYASGSNIFSYDIGARSSTPLTTLPNDEKNRWYVQEAHVLPSSDRIIFFGGEAMKDGQPLLGPHSGEQTWWWIPPTGGTPQHWSEIVGKGSGASSYSASPRGDRIAVSHTSFAGATCPSYGDAAVIGFDLVDGISSTLPITATSAPMVGTDPDGAWVTQVNGISWSPDGTEFAYGVERHACSPEGPAEGPISQTIYVWDGDPDKEPRISIEGSYPNWVRNEEP